MVTSSCPEQYYFINGSGDTVNLSEQTDYLSPFGVDGRFMSAPNFISQAVPLQDGATWRATLLQPRPITIPITVQGVDRAQVRSLAGALMSSMNPKLGAGTFRIVREDGTARDLSSCFYENGFDGGETSDGAFVLQQFALAFRAFDPYWYDTTAQTMSYTTGTSPGSFFPILPLVLASSTVFGQPTITNDGDAEAYPVWTITGPGDTLVLRNNTTGEELDVAVTVNAGRSLVVDTRPGYEAITLDGVNIFADASGDLWPFQIGSNSITIGLNSATAATVVGLSYQRRWLSA